MNDHGLLSEEDGLLSAGDPRGIVPEILEGASRGFQGKGILFQTFKSFYSERSWIRRIPYEPQENDRIEKSVV